MTERDARAGRAARRGGAILDVASGFGQDSLALAARGASVVGAEPSARMTALGAARVREGRAARVPSWVRGWSDALPVRRRRASTR